MLAAWTAPLKEILSPVQSAGFTVPIELVTAVSQRTHSVVQIPKEIEEVLGKHLGAGSKKGLRADSQALLHELRSRSRSTARGGLNSLAAYADLQETGEPDAPQHKVPILIAATPS